MRTITVAGGNLYQLAMQYLNDATQWNRIAQANNLIDPVLIGLTTLKIPPVDSNAGGGVFVASQ
jgi:nucleoid-associated protein YgaU